MPPTSNQPIENSCSRTFSYAVLLQIISWNSHNRILGKLTFNILCDDVHSKLWSLCQAVSSNHHQWISNFTVKGNLTGTRCRAVISKGKVRYSNPLTKQNAQGLVLCVGSSHLKTKKEITRRYTKNWLSWLMKYLRWITK